MAPLADHGPELILQDDTFFACPNGRLKLRAFPAGEGQLIFYARAGQAGPKEEPLHHFAGRRARHPARAALAAAWGENGPRAQGPHLVPGGPHGGCIWTACRGAGGIFSSWSWCWRTGNPPEAGVAEAHALRWARLGVAARAID
ncbi:adenylate cyclase [Cupriavidus basilensis]